jgi:hypothetical protein
MIEAIAETTAPAVPGQTYADLWKNAVALVIETKRMGITRVVTGHAPAGADPEMTRTIKYLLNDPAYRRIAQMDHRARLRIGKFGLPASKHFKGVVLIPLTLIERVEEIIASYESERRAAVEMFIAAYPAAVTRALAQLGSVADPDDYPPAESLPGLFSLSVQYLTFDLPGVLSGLSKTAHARAVEEGRRRMADAVEDVQLHLRQTMAGLVEQLKNRLTPDPITGSAKVLQARTVTNLLDFLDVFAARNIVAGDQDLPVLVTQAKQLLAGVDVPDLRTDQALRQVVLTGLDDMSKRLDGLVGKKPSRRYVWDDSDDVTPESGV